MRPKLLLSFATCILSSLSRAQSIGAFYSSTGPTIISLNTLSGNFSYNVYGQQGFSDMKSFAPTYPPKNGTSVAVSGYSNPNTVYGAIFYQIANNSIAQQLFKCRYSSGECSNYGALIISTKVTVPVRSGTGLSSSLLSADFGYRVTYEDTQGSVRQLSYSNTTKGLVTYWADGTLVNNVTVANSSALATTFVQSPNDTVPAQQTIYQASNDNIIPFVNNRSTYINDTQTWSQAPTIDYLPNWNAENGTFSTIVYNQWPMLFYIDNLRQFQWIWSRDGGQTWQAQPLTENSILPLADTSNAPVAAVTSVNATKQTASVFYISGGQMIQSIMTDWSFAPYTVVKAATPPITTTNTTAPIQRQEKDTKNKKITIGASIGASVGFLIVAVVVAWLLSRRKRAIPNTPRPESIGEWKGSESDFSHSGGKAELPGESAQLHELDHDPECILLHQLQLIRMFELKGEIPVELQNCEAPRPELDHTLCKCELDASVMYELPTSSEKEKGTSIAESSRSKEGKDNVVDVSVKEVQELPMWSWAILRREKEEQGTGIETLDLEKSPDVALKSVKENE